MEVPQTCQEMGLEDFLQEECLNLNLLDEDIVST